MLNSLPNAPGYLSSNNNAPQQKDLDSLLKNERSSTAANVSGKVTIRGKAPSAMPRDSVPPTIRGGGGNMRSDASMKSGI